MTETKTFTCIKCHKAYPYEPTGDMELMEEPIICLACYEAIPSKSIDKPASP